MKKNIQPRLLFFLLSLQAVLFFIFLNPIVALSQQGPDTSYIFKITAPVYKKDKGSIIAIDEGHNNIHTANGKYSPLKRLLEEDGYRVISLDTLTKESLSQCKIFITANPLHVTNIKRWILPTPSAFSDTEIEILKDWVSKGGKLFVITDHMPCAGAVETLINTFGFEISNGFVTGPGVGDYIRFKTKDGSLAPNTITNGRNQTERVDSVSTFTGSAFKIPAHAESILTFKGNFTSMMPDTAWRFNKKTPRILINEWSQGAILKQGKGKVAVFGEAGMFTAQLGNGNKFGFNSPHAPQNSQFTLNVIHWLDGILN